jgi:hypothetical protein
VARTIPNKRMIEPSSKSPVAKEEVISQPLGYKDFEQLFYELLIKFFNIKKKINTSYRHGASDVANYIQGINLIITT